MFSRIFGYEFLMKNIDRMEATFYNSKTNLICVMYKHKPNNNIIIWFGNHESDGVFIGYYDDDGNPAIEGADHYTFVSFNDIDNVRSVVSEKIFALFNVKIDL